MEGVGPGTTLDGRYTTQRRIEQRHGAERWTADDTTLGRSVVVLCLPEADHRAAALLDAARRAAGLDTPTLQRVLDVGRENIDKYGAVAIEPADQPVIDGDEVVRVTGLVEKPPVDEAPSSLAIIGRYVLSPTVFEVLRDTPPGRGGEIQLTDALATLVVFAGLSGAEQTLFALFYALAARLPLRIAPLTVTGPWAAPCPADPPQRAPLDVLRRRVHGRRGPP